MKIEPLKDKRIAISQYYRQKLHDFILKNADFIFSKENEANAWCDFNRFPKSKTDREHLCLPSEPFLVDRNYDGVHTYCVCTISQNGKITAEFPVIQVDKIPYGVWRNGYFLLPDILKNFPDRDA